MTGQTRLFMVLLLGGGAGFLLFRASERSWGGKFTARLGRTFQSAPFQTGDAPTFRVELALPTGTAGPANIEIPEDVYHKLSPGDSYERRMRVLPFLGIEAFDHRVTREGRPVAEWNEGYVPLYLGVGLGGLVVGAVATALLILLLGAFGLRKAPDV